MFIVIVLVLAIAFALLIVDAVRSMSARRAAREARVLAAEDEYVNAEVSRNEAELRRMVDDTFGGRINHGQTFDKEALIQEILEGRMLSQSRRERSVHIEGDTAVVVGMADLRYANGAEGERLVSLRYMTTYVKREGQWRLIAQWRLIGPQVQRRATD